MRSRWAFSRSHPNLAFWPAFAALNALLFVPAYLFNRDSATLLPGALFDGGWRLGLDRLFIYRLNLDPLRLSVEFTLAVALWATVRPLRRCWTGWIVAALYLLLLAYYTYEAVLGGIWLLDPIFYREWFLARDGLPFLAAHLGAAWWLYLAAAAGLALIVGALLLGLRLLLRSAAAPGFGRASRAAIALLAAFAVVVTSLYRPWTARPEMVVSSWAFKLDKNVVASLKLHHDVTVFDDRTVQQVYDFSTARLARTPDIYLIFVESYGSVLYQRDYFKRTYAALATRIEEQLQDAGWTVRSALSESPTWGGGSWMAYSSLLMGMRIDSHPQYLALFDRYQLKEYPNLGRTLQALGYHYTWLSALAEDDSDAQWAKQRRFMGMDELVRYSDFDYVGPTYSWGPAPPDQFTLNFAYEQARAASRDQPLFFATITQNSHYPWAPQPELVDDWRTLNTPQPQHDPIFMDDMPTVEKRVHYIKAITYQLETLADFILRHGDDNSIFILVGDHQPPQVSRRADGWATPIHIIAKDAAFVDAFADYGFTPGLRVPAVEPKLHHEDFYALFMRVLLDQYGQGQVASEQFPVNSFQ